WSVKNSEALYNFEGWGAPYFLLGEECDGRVVVRPAGVCEAEIDQVEVDLYAAATAVRERLGSSGPLLFRFPDIACSQSAKLHSAFQSAALTWGLNSLHRGVLPVKCCHDASLLLSLVLAGAREGFGLEAGSKAELILSSDYSLPTPFLICNGYKDGDYVGLAVQSAALRVNTFIVIEKPSDLQYYITAVGDLPRSAHRPFLGIRVRLTTGHSGHWGPTSGDNAKFGLCAKEMIWLVASLADESMLDCLRLLHFHVGSQVSNIATFKEAMRESTQMYAELVRLGAPMGFVDVGGGLGVEYHGSQGWGGQRSTNYDMQNYANDVVAALQDTIMRTGIKPPVLVTESGRAIVSAADVLIFEVVSTEPRGAMPSFDDDSFLLQNFQSILGSMTIINQSGQQNISKIQESLNDAIQFRQEADRLFKLGIMSLEGRAEAEELFSSIRSLALDFARTIPDTNIFPTEVSLFAVEPLTWCHANLSVFRSLPDAWAIRQLFPVAPLHRLSEEPSIIVSIADLTCDSDGRIDQFIGSSGSNANAGGSLLPLHPLRVNETYLVAAFLVGAYQDSLGSRGHNLFGSPPVANLFLSGSPFHCIAQARRKTRGADV
ncbi:uncharacterized protein MICPUCDRAFT_1338, partial [Micromonas pusilla CCMP1545]